MAVSIARIVIMTCCLCAFGYFWGRCFIAMRQFMRWMIERDGKYNPDGTPKDP